MTVDDSSNLSEVEALGVIFSTKVEVNFGSSISFLTQACMFLVCKKIVPKVIFTLFSFMIG